MDILTTKGQQSARDEQDAINIWLNRYPAFSYIHTDKDRESAVDGCIVKDGSIHAIVETKCRYNLSVEKFMKEYGGMWLVTFDKIMVARSLSKKLCAPLIGFLYLVEDKTLLFKKIIDDNGEFACGDMLVKKTLTQRTINNTNQIARDNAFIDMRDAKIITSKSYASSPTW